MIKSGREIIILAPREIYLEARALRRQRKFKEALALLESGAVEFAIGSTLMTAQIKNNSGKINHNLRSNKEQFKKGNKFGRNKVRF